MRAALLSRVLAAVATITVATSPARADADLLIDAPGTLAALEARVGPFAARVPLSALVTDVVSEVQRYSASVAAIKDRDQAKVTIFDPSWLRDPRARFRLIGLVGRLDRLLTGDGPCGEFRLVYRLAYDYGAQTSDLPMTVSLAYDLASERDDVLCRHAAAAPLTADLPVLFGPASPYAPALRDPKRLKTVEINLQIARWAATDPHHRSDQSLYLLRAYAFDQTRGTLHPQGLENTPDPVQLRSDADLRARFLRWLAHPATLRSVAAGTMRVPAEFLAMRAVSVSPYGLKRLVNRPFSAVLSGVDLSGLGLQNYPGITTPAALLRRLDTQTCAGCHQSLAVAGFHLLGAATPRQTDYNRLASGRSPHLEGILPWRRAFAAARAAGRQDRDTVPFAERPANRRSGVGEACALHDPGLRAWVCADGLRCFDDFPASGARDVGRCYPLHVASEARVGDPCDRATLSSEWGSFRDHLEAPGTTACRGEDGQKGLCVSGLLGFPGGVCSHECTADAPGDRCVATPLAVPFNACLAGGGKFFACLRQNAVSVLWPQCARHADCREDYACTAVAGGAFACLPTYFVPELTFEPHPLAAD